MNIYLIILKLITWFIIEWRISSSGALFPTPLLVKLQHAFFQPFVMEIQTQEARIILAIKAIRSSKKLSCRSAAKIYKVPETTLRYRMAGLTARPEN